MTEDDAIAYLVRHYFSPSEVTTALKAKEPAKALRSAVLSNARGFSGPHSPKVSTAMGGTVELRAPDDRFVLRMRIEKLAQIAIEDRRSAPSTTNTRRNRTLARSTANKAKAAKKKTERKAPRPKAQITARAKLVNVASATGKVKTGAYQTETVNAVRLTIDVNMGAPATAPAWPEYKGRNGWGRSGFIERELRKLKPAKPEKATKAKKGEAETKAPEAPATILQAFDAAAETKRLSAEYDAELRTKWERECQKANNANARFLERASAFAMFLALRGQDVQLTLSPIQQGFVEMFAGQAQPAELPSGEEEDEDDGADLLNYGDEDDGE